MRRTWTYKRILIVSLIYWALVFFIAWYWCHSRMLAARAITPVQEVFFAGEEHWYFHAPSGLVPYFIFAAALFRIFRISIRKFGKDLVNVPGPSDRGRYWTRYPKDYTE